MTDSYAATIKDVHCPLCKAHKGSPCKRPSGHTVFGGDFHKDRKERHAFVMTLDQKQDQGYHGARRLASLLLKVECPLCKSPEGRECDMPVTLYDYHYHRLAAYFEMRGIDLQSRSQKPYTHWPDADDYEKWGIFMHRSSGNQQYGSKPVKMPASGRLATFSRFEDAYHWEAKLENNHRWRQKNRGCLGVFPMWLASNGTWAHHEY